MKAKTIDAIRDLALRHEEEDLQVAYELMSLAHRNRPKGLFIKNKLAQYKKQLRFISPENLELKHLIDKGDLAIIPIGFRCFTAGKIKEKLNIEQASLPFDSGFFSPHSVASVLSDPNIQLAYNDEGLTHQVCVKTEEHTDSVHGFGIKFELSSYEKIDSIVTSRGVKGINKYLDTTYGYYTLDVNHQFVLAHYNWHKSSNFSKSKGIVNPEENLKIINSMLNKRIKRMFDLCNKAKYIFFVLGEFQKYNYIQIGKEYYPLNDFSQLEKVLDANFNVKFSIINIDDINSAEDLLGIISNTK